MIPAAGPTRGLKLITLRGETHSFGIVVPKAEPGEGDDDLSEASSTRSRKLGMRMQNSQSIGARAARRKVELKFQWREKSETNNIARHFCFPSIDFNLNRGVASRTFDRVVKLPADSPGSFAAEINEFP